MLRMINFLKRGSRNFPHLIYKSSGVSTWSPLATAFNTLPVQEINFTRNETGLFNIPQLTTPDGFHLLKENVIFRTDELINEAISPQRSRKMVEIFDELSDSLCKVADLAEFIRLAHPKRAFAYAAEDACITISGVVEKLNTHKELYQALNNSYANGDIMKTNAVDDHVANLFLFDFEQCGIHLEENLRKKVVYLNDCILQLGQRFMNGAVNPREVSKKYLPDNIRSQFASSGDNIIVAGLYADSSNPLTRESAYRLFLYPDERQDELLSDLLKARHDLAVTCGFPTYAHRAIKSSTAESPELVQEFLDSLSRKLAPRASADFEFMQKLKIAELGESQKLEAWDTPYYTSKLKKKCLEVSSSDFLPYFSLGACMDGLNLIMKSLFGITLQNSEMLPGELWSPEIYKLAVTHETEGLLGYIYCDLFDRSGKPNQDCHFTIQGGRVNNDGSYQNPIVVIMLNLTPPKWGQPSLLTPSMVDNLFHEMGHAMHSMLARTTYQHVTGTRCSTDFAEVPSVLMEYFASDPRVLKTFARHYKTQEPIPDEMLKRLCISKHLFAASDTQLQLFYSALDQVYHGDPQNQEATTTKTLQKVQEKYYGLPYIPDTAWQLRFSHLVGYGAKYYSYLISRAIASWIWQSFFEADPFSRSQGELYRRECLAHGGGVPSKHLVANFLKRDINAENLANSLVNEIDNRNEEIEKISKKSPVY